MEQLDIIQPVLVKFMQQKEEIAKQIAKAGIVPIELCKRCEGNSKRWLVPFTDKEEAFVRRFSQWLKQHEVTSVESFVGEYGSTVRVRGTKAIPKKRSISIENGIRQYTYRQREFEESVLLVTENDRINKSLFSGLEIKSCNHFNPEKNEISHLLKQDRFFDRTTPRYIHSLFLACKACSDEINNRECDAVSKTGFTYASSCIYEKLLLEKTLDEAGLVFEKGEERDSSSNYLFMWPPHESRLLFIRKHGILISKSSFSLEGNVAQLNPKLIVYFGDKSEITKLLDFSTSVLIVSPSGDLYFYDYTRPVEESIDAIVNAVIEKLEPYSEEIRGNEHERMIKTFVRIGQELGYVPEREHSEKGIRLDCVWHGKKGGVKATIEVETEGGWKKDIISTWELEPELSIIVTYQKTDYSVKGLVNFALMKYVPHKILFINMETKNAYLFDKQQIIRKYSLMGEEKEELKVKDF